MSATSGLSNIPNLLVWGGCDAEQTLTFSIDTLWCRLHLGVIGESNTPKESCEGVTLISCGLRRSSLPQGFEWSLPWTNLGRESLFLSALDIFPGTTLACLLVTSMGA